MRARRPRRRRPGATYIIPERKRAPQPAPAPPWGIAVQDYGPDVALIEPAFIDRSVRIFGKVTVREGASIWPNAVIRAENHAVEIGPHSNVQDFCMVHVGLRSGTQIGAHCSITHHCTIHGARLGDNCLVGVNATLMDGVVVGDNCTIAGGTFVPEGAVIPTTPS